MIKSKQFMKANEYYLLNEHTGICVGGLDITAITPHNPIASLSDMHANVSEYL
jgi:hypothetical protein